MDTRYIPALIASAVVGIGMGIGGYTFVYAKGAAYLTNDPRACANCHIMEEQYAGWTRSSHRDVAGCNDCHTPPGFVAKYLTKASNGFWHSYAFTTGDFHDPIQIKKRNREVTEQACRHCHQHVVDAVDALHTHAPGEAQPCTRCHNSVGHMEGTNSGLVPLSVGGDSHGR